ncbi:hypothetical protein GWI33_013006 [Rhynchophorus ferrugineus]|uniref:Uncharacterized protein n=1 Tax=Rhynchophorus ferrugineus TaxID=354439 RepID=A0A834IA81_RHYFE|nr:hypothetical protein GWI33_013006 [Rhynchophorus ferrugineus]
MISGREGDRGTRGFCPVQYAALVDRDDRDEKKTPVSRSASRHRESKQKKNAPGSHTRRRAPINFSPVHKNPPTPADGGPGLALISPPICVLSAVFPPLGHTDAATPRTPPPLLHAGLPACLPADRSCDFQFYRRYRQDDTDVVSK